MAKPQPVDSPNFGSILNKPMSQTERPKPLPVGSYICVVKGLPRFDKSSKKQTPFVEFTLQPLQAGDDVDAEALEDMGGIVNKTIRATYYTTEDAMWRLKKFLTDCGIDEDDNKSFDQAISETPGCQVVAHLKHQASDDGEAVYAQISGTAAVE